QLPAIQVGVAPLAVVAQIDPRLARDNGAVLPVDFLARGPQVTERIAADQEFRYGDGDSPSLVRTSQNRQNRLHHQSPFDPASGRDRQQFLSIPGQAGMARANGQKRLTSYAWGPGNPKSEGITPRLTLHAQQSCRFFSAFFAGRSAVFCIHGPPTP